MLTRASMETSPQKAYNVLVTSQREDAMDKMTIVGDVFLFVFGLPLALFLSGIAIVGAREALKGSVSRFLERVHHWDFGMHRHA